MDFKVISHEIWYNVMEGGGLNKLLTQINGTGLKN